MKYNFDLKQPARWHHMFCFQMFYKILIWKIKNQLQSAVKMAAMIKIVALSIQLPN